MAAIPHFEILQANPDLKIENEIWSMEWDGRLGCS
jgi:hypothetical protein